MLKKILLLLTNDLCSDGIISKEKYSKDFSKEGTKIFELQNLINKKDIVFIVGNWGSGKSTLVKSFTEQVDIKKNFNIRWASFQPISNLNEAYLHLTERISWLILIIIFSLIYSFFWLSNLKQYLSTLFTLASIFVLYTNQFRITYIFLSILSYSNKTRIVIIDDFDRSSLPVSDQFALLSNLWPFKTKYIITYGYHNSNQREIVVEFIKKLNAPYVVMNTDIFNLINHATQLDSRFPFEAELWMKKISHRDIENVVFKIKDKFSNLNDIETKIVYVKAMYNLFISNYELQSPRDYVARDSLDHVFNPTTNNGIFNNQINSFGLTISEFLKSLTLSHREVGYSNWQETFNREFFITNTAYESNQIEL